MRDLLDHLSPDERAELARFAAHLIIGRPLPLQHALYLACLQAENAREAGVVVEAPPGVPEAMLTVAEVAADLGVSRDAVYRQAREWPFTRKLGRRTLRFDPGGFRRWKERQRPG